MRNDRLLKGTNIFINEDLTKTRATLAWKSRILKREKKIRDTWTRDGMIFIKNNQDEIRTLTSDAEWHAMANALK